MKFRFDIDGVLFELVPSSDDKKLQGMGNAPLCLKVEDIQQAVEGLQEKGVPTSPIQNEENGMLAAFYDPDGNEICLWQYR